MDEEGYGSVIGTAVVVLVLLISISALSGAFESTFDEFDESKIDRNTQMSNKIQTDVEIDNVNPDFDDNHLEVKVKNTGSTVLDKSKTDLFVNGGLISEENIENMVVNGDKNTNIWLPEEILTINTENTVDNVLYRGSPEKVKVVTEYGVSDYENKVV